MQKNYDAMVIGGGPAGMTAALYLLRAGFSLAWVEKLAPGGQVLMTEMIENYPGFPGGIKGYELSERFEKQLEPHSWDMFRDEVQQMELEEGKNRVLVGDQWIESKTVVLCSGSSWKKLGIEGEQRLNGRGISYCALCDGNFFRGQDVACVGGGDTALEESLYLTKLVNKVYLIHRRDKFRGSKIYQDKVLAHPKIEVIFDSVPSSFLGEDSLEGLEIKNVRTGMMSTLDVTGTFVFIGSAPQADFVPAEVKRDASGFIITDQDMQTNIRGIFAAGDIRSKSCRQIATAVGDGATAAHCASIFLEQHA